MDTEKPLVLIVDDNAMNIDLIEDALRGDCRLGIATSGEAALKYTNKHRPDLILLDIMMAGMDGYQVCTRLKASPHTRQIPVIFITGLSETRDKTRGFQVGAIDYITKPFHLAEVKARVNAHLSLQKIRDREIQIAAKIQKDLLQTHLTPDMPGVRVTQLARPSQQVDGDFFDFFQINDRCFDLVVGDVMGKGIAAALLGAALKSHFLRVLHKLSLGIDACGIPPIEDIVSGVHAGMIDELGDLETFATLCYARFDLAARQLSFIDCGHMRTVHYRRATGDCQLLRGENMPLGFPETTPFRPTDMAFGPGDVFCFYSDGLTEACTPDGRFYGENRLVRFMETAGQHSPEKIVRDLWQDVVRFSGSEQFQDDLTCLVIKFDDMPSISLKPAAASLEIRSDLSALRQVREFIQNFCNMIPGSLFEKSISQIELAGNEVVANIIKHAYAGRTGQKIQIKARQAIDSISFRFYDWGEKFNPDAVAPPSFDGSREGGFGIHIITQSVSNLAFTTDKDGTNCTTLTINTIGKRAP